MSRPARILRLLWVALTLAIAVRVLILSRDPNQYFQYVYEGRAWEWRPLGVAIVVGFVLVEGAAAYFAWFGVRWRRWMRAVAVLPLLLPMALLAVVTIVHAPGYVLQHAVWAAGVTMAMGVTLAIEIGRGVLGFLRRP